MGASRAGFAGRSSVPQQSGDFADPVLGHIGSSLRTQIQGQKKPAEAGLLVVLFPEPLPAAVPYHRPDVVRSFATAAQTSWPNCGCSP